MENSKLINLDALDKIAKELRRKALADISQQEEEIEKVRDMFGGKSFRYVLQEEYDNLSEEEKNDPSIVWSIIDAEELVSKEYVDEEVAKINDGIENLANTISLGIHTDGAVYVFIDGNPVGTGIFALEGYFGSTEGYVDKNNNIILADNLDNGTYTLKYENEDGTYTTIGQFDIPEEDK